MGLKIFDPPLQLDDDATSGWDGMSLPASVPPNVTAIVQAIDQGVLPSAHNSSPQDWDLTMLAARSGENHSIAPFWFLPTGPLASIRMYNTAAAATEDTQRVVGFIDQGITWLDGPIMLSNIASNQEDLWRLESFDSKYSELLDSATFLIVLFNSDLAADWTMGFRHPDDTGMTERVIDADVDFGQFVVPCDVNGDLVSIGAYDSAMNARNVAWIVAVGTVGTFINDASTESQDPTGTGFELVEAPVSEQSLAFVEISNISTTTAFTFGIRPDGSSSTLSEASLIAGGRGTVCMVTDGGSPYEYEIKASTPADLESFFIGSIPAKPDISGVTARALGPHSIQVDFPYMPSLDSWFVELDDNNNWTDDDIAEFTISSDQTVLIIDSTDDLMVPNSQRFLRITGKNAEYGDSDSVEIEVHTEQFVQFTTEERPQSAAGGIVTGTYVLAIDPAEFSGKIGTGGTQVAVDLEYVGAKLDSLASENRRLKLDGGFDPILVAVRPPDWSEVKPGFATGSGPMEGGIVLASPKIPMLFAIQVFPEVKN